MKTYKIYKGCHYSNFFPRIQLIYQVNHLSQGGRIVFDESCKYEIAEASCVNKLFGFCFGFGVHKNSVRFGWTYNAPTNQIYIWSYFYINGKLHKKKIFSCELNEEHTYKIEVHKISSELGHYTFRFLIDGKENGDFEKIQSDKCFITTLGPYFGGNTRAPHTMKIEYNGHEISKS